MFHGRIPRLVISGLVIPGIVIPSLVMRREGMPYIRRAGEPTYLEPFVRGERLVQKDGSYFYRTRECQYIGPFDSAKDAEFDLNLFVEVNVIDRDIHTMIC